MKYLIFFLLTMLFTSCNSDESEQFIIDTDINIAVKNSDGNDLLDSDSPNSIDENSIKIIYEINGEQVEVNDTDLDYSRGFFIYQHENEYRIRIFPNTSQSTEYPVTYIKWDDTDTIKVDIERNRNSEICNKVWFNENLVWEAYETERFFEIIK